MTKCCSCNSSGVCKNCKCARAGTPCTNCAPSRHGKCLNHVLLGENNPSQPHAEPLTKDIAIPSSQRAPLQRSKRFNSTVIISRSCRSPELCSTENNEEDVSQGSVPPQVSKFPPPPANVQVQVNQDDDDTYSREGVSYETSDAAASEVSPQNSSNEAPTFRSQHVRSATRSASEVRAGVTHEVARVQGLTTLEANIENDDTPVHGPDESDNSCMAPGDRETDYVWGEVDGKTFTMLMEGAYAEVVHWRRNIFNVPSGSVGKDFVRELSHLFNSLTQRSAYEAVAMCAAMTMPHLLLQKTHAKSRSKENVAVLERRLKAWRKGDIQALLHEGRAIQSLLPMTTMKQGSDESSLSRSFASFVHQGRIRAALRLLDNSQTRGGVLSLDQIGQETGGKSVRQILKEKHPKAEIPTKETLLPRTNGSSETYHPVIFEKITADSIRRTALRVEGAAGPSGIDACGWRRLCTSFGPSSDDLCRALADFAKRICSERVPDRHLAAYAACRLVPLDKCPGVRPIGICEVVRRIVGKAALQVIGPCVQRVAGTLQLCAGQAMGIEAAVHAMQGIYGDDSTEAVLMVDASNAFNRLNRKAALHNAEELCPALATILKNTYGRPADLFVDGETLKSDEGTTQGDPLAMSMYAIGTLPLIRELSQCAQTRQIWYADDASDAGKLVKIKIWWDHLTANGPAYGYFPNGSKTWLLVKEKYHQQAQQLFGGTNINITTEGRRLLGAAIGDAAFVTGYINRLVSNITRRVGVLAKIAKAHPQAAYTAFTRGLIGEWTFLIRTMGNSAPQLQPVEATIRQHFIPALTGRAQPGDTERDLLALPTRHGGLGISNPTAMTSLIHEGSVRSTEPLRKLIEEQRDELDNACEEVSRRRSAERARRQKQHQAEARSLFDQLGSQTRRVAELAAERGASSWLTVLPIDRHGFTLHKGAFRDALCLRYNWPPAQLPSICVCGQAFDSSHSMSCPTGGLPSLRHNELRDITARLLKETCYDVATEPVLQPVTGETLLGRCSNREDNARLDIATRGFWGCGAQRAFFDVRVFNPCAPSYRCTQIRSLYQRQEKEKRRQYQQRVCEIERGSFTPLVFATSGGMGAAATVFYKRLAGLLATKRKADYGQTMAWIRATVSFSLIRSAILCLRGSRGARYSHPSVLPPVDLVISESGL